MTALESLPSAGDELSYRPNASFDTDAPLNFSPRFSCCYRVFTKTFFVWLITGRTFRKSEFCVSVLLSSVLCR